MARKLKTYHTSLGFFELAVAAPSMKAALEAWGSGTNLFQLGAARETRDPAIVAAAMARPGVVVKRPVGSKGAFGEHARLPKHLPLDEIHVQEPNRDPKIKEPSAESGADKKLAREAARARQEQARREKERQRRAEKVAASEALLERARLDHETRMRQLESERAQLERKLDAENARWEKKKTELEAALLRARE